MTIRALAASAVSVAMVSTAALATAPIVAPAAIVPSVIGPTEVNAPPFGYIELFGGGFLGSESGSFFVGTYDENWKGLLFGGAGRVALQPSMNFAMQLDTWAYHWSGHTDFVYHDVGDSFDDWNFSRNVVGAGSHLMLGGPAGGLGALVSLGSVWSAVDGSGSRANFYNLGIEAAINAERWRMHAQGGLTRPFGPVLFPESGTRYAQLVVAVYPRPNLALSLTVGVERTLQFLFASQGSNWGARIELQPEGRRAAVFVAYQGWAYESASISRSGAGTEHAVIVGLRLLGGAPTLQALDEAVGLADYNPIFGVHFPH